MWTINFSNVISMRDQAIKFKNEDKGFYVNFLYDSKGLLIKQGIKNQIVQIDNKIDLQTDFAKQQHPRRSRVARSGPRTDGRAVCRIHSGKPSGKVPRSRPEMSEATRRLRAILRLAVKSCKGAYAPALM